METKVRVLKLNFSGGTRGTIQYKLWWWPFWITYYTYDLDDRMEYVERRARDLYKEWIRKKH